MGDCRAHATMGGANAIARLTFGTRNLAAVPVEQSGRHPGAYGSGGYRDCMFRPQGRSFRAPVVAAGPNPFVWSSRSGAALHVHRTKVQLSIGTVPCKSALDQSSTTNRGTRSNSFVFDVTKIKLRDSACPAISVS